MLASRGRYVSEFDEVLSILGAENADRDDENEPILGEDSPGDVIGA